MTLVLVMAKRQDCWIVGLKILTLDFKNIGGSMNIMVKKTVTTPLIAFRAKTRHGSFIRDSYRTDSIRYKAYHLSLKKFNIESSTTLAFCNRYYYINWAAPFEIITPDEIDKVSMILSQRKDRPLCVKCIKGIVERKQLEEEKEGRRRKRRDREEEAVPLP
jgi:hypothetical protein